MSDDSLRYDRRTAIKTFGAASGIALAGCVGDDDDNTGDGLEGQTVQIILDEDSPEAQDFYNEMSEEFQERTGANTNIEYTGHGLSSDERVIQLLQAGDPPEIYLADQEMAATLGHEGVLDDVTDVVEDLSDQYGEPVSGRAIIDDTDYAIPKHADYGTFWYRSDLSDIEPNSWEEMEEYFQDVEENHDINGIYHPAGTGHASDMSAVSWAWNNGARFFEWDGDNLQVVMNEGENRERWLEVLEAFETWYEYSPTTTDADWGPLQNSIEQEVAASAWYGGSRPKDNAAPRDFNENVEIVPGGMPERAEDAPIRDGGNSWVVFAGSNTEAARAWLELFYEEERYLDHFFEVDPITINPPYPDLRDSDEYWEMTLDHAPDGWTEDQLETYVVDSAQNLQTMSTETDPPNPYGGAVVQSNDIGQMVQDVLVADTTPEEALEEYSESIQQTISDTEGI